MKKTYYSLKGHAHTIYSDKTELVKEFGEEFVKMFEKLPLDTDPLFQVKANFKSYFFNDCKNSVLFYSPDKEGYHLFFDVV